MHPVFDEILRASTPIRPDVLRRWQSVIRNEVLPTWEALEDQATRPRKGKASSEVAA